MTDTVTPAAPNAAPYDKGAKLQAEMKKAWNKLSDDDVKLYTTNRDQFFGKLKEKHSVSKEDGAKRIQEMEKASGESSSTQAVPIKAA